VAAALLWIVGIVLDPGIPDLFVAPGEEWLTFITENESGIYVSRLFYLLGNFLLIVFVGTLRTRLSAAEGSPEHWTAIAFGSGIATAAMLTLAQTPVAAAAAASDGLEASAAQALGIVEYAFFIAAGITAAALLVSTGVIATRTTALPSWLGWAGIVLAVLMLAGGTVGFIALLPGFPLWLIATSIILTLRGRSPVSTGAS
jgi:hypothetical protein